MGIRSSLRIESALRRDVGFRYLVANQMPDFRTIAAFRMNHLEAFNKLFPKMVKLCSEVGLVKLGGVTVDGRRLKGNASITENRTRERIEKEIEAILEEAEGTDREWDEKDGADQQWEELPEALRTREGRLQNLKEAQKRLEAREAAQKEEQAQKIKEDKEQEEPTGPEGRADHRGQWRR